MPAVKFWNAGWGVDSNDSAVAPAGTYHNEQQQKITKSDTHRRWRVQPKIEHDAYYQQKYVILQIQRCQMIRQHVTISLDLAFFLDTS